ncbi:tyrosine-type recombinase/integrase, partial [Microbacterium sp. 69-10]|uniref:tyrosine-type recombinase/integrase n=1 Tax=Microbacterium sp. 69-10 TaxID=1895783 RepID=UPI0025DB329D
VSRLLPPGVTMHALRHAFATRTYNVNRDVFAVQQLLGHSSAATTQRYVQVSDDSLRALVEAGAR